MESKIESEYSSTWTKRRVSDCCRVTVWTRFRASFIELSEPDPSNAQVLPDLDCHYCGGTYSASYTGAS